VLNEVDEAARLRIPIIPVKLEHCEAPFGYRHVQAADLSDWRGEQNHPEWIEVRDGARAAIAGRALGARVQPQSMHEPPPPRSRKKQSGGVNVASLAFAAMMGFGGWIAWREFAPDMTPTERASPVSQTAPPSTEQEEPAWDEENWRNPRGVRRNDDLPEEVRFLGRDDVRGVFRRTRGSGWVERNSEAGFAGYYRQRSAEGGKIELYDRRRDLWALIDLDDREIWIKSAGEDRYSTRYRIAEIEHARETP
jgi:hypothetical protein